MRRGTGVADTRVGTLMQESKDLLDGILQSLGKYTGCSQLKVVEVVQLLSFDVPYCSLARLDKPSPMPPPMETKTTPRLVSDLTCPRLHLSFFRHRQI